MRVDDLHYDLPPERIAQHPAARRDASRLLVVDRANGGLRHETFARLPELLPPRALLVLNDTRVLPARLRLRRCSGGRIEGLFLHEPEPGAWEIMLTESRRLRPGELLTVEPGRQQCLKLIGRQDAGVWRASPVPAGDAHAILMRHGEPPLPPYIKRRRRERDDKAEREGEGEQGRAGEMQTKTQSDAGKERQVNGGRKEQRDGGGKGQKKEAGEEQRRAAIEEQGEPESSNLKSEISNPKSEISNLKSQISNRKFQISNLKSEIPDLKSEFSEDSERYQTIYARQPGAIAAPTAGLHFTPEIFQALAAAGMSTAFVTLHVGVGTFAPIRCENLADHVMHAEWYECPEATAAAVNTAREEGRPIVAVGTTSVRVLESCADENRRLRAGSGWTRLFIYPPYSFKIVDAMLTNFHLPGSTLLAMIFAFAGREKILAAYKEAIRSEYRFYSYGDAMLIV